MLWPRKRGAYLEPTPAQERSLTEDGGGFAVVPDMNAWLQGDVGSGKTVSLSTAAVGYTAGFQSALMVPNRNFG